MKNTGLQLQTQEEKMSQENKARIALSIAEDKSLSGEAEYIKLSSNENPLGPSPKAIAAASNELAQANLYPPRNDIRLKEALAKFHGNGLSKDNFISGNGGVDIIGMAENTLIKSGDHAIISPPCFAVYAISLSSKGIEVDQAPLIDETYDVDVDAILGSITDKTRLIYLCNPNNPTGTCFGQDVLDAILDGMPDHVTLIYDEVYYQFAKEFGLPDAQKHVRDGRNIIIIHSFSKAYGLAGMRIGYGIAPADLIKRMESKKHQFHVNAASLSAAIAALEDDEHIKKTVANNSAELPKMTKGIEALGLEVTPSYANSVLCKCPDGTSAAEMVEAFIENDVMVRPAFYLPNHLRVSIGTPEANKGFLEALAKLV